MPITRCGKRSRSSSPSGEASSAASAGDRKISPSAGTFDVPGRTGASGPPAFTYRPVIDWPRYSVFQKVEYSTWSSDVDLSPAVDLSRDAEALSTSTALAGPTAASRAARSDSSVVTDDAASSTATPRPMPAPVSASRTHDVRPPPIASRTPSARSENHRFT